MGPLSEVMSPSECMSPSPPMIQNMLKPRRASIEPTRAGAATGRVAIEAARARSCPIEGVGRGRTEERVSNARSAMGLLSRLTCWRTLAPRERGSLSEIKRWCNPYRHPCRTRWLYVRIPMCNRGCPNTWATFRSCSVRELGMARRKSKVRSRSNRPVRAHASERSLSLRLCARIQFHRARCGRAAGNHAAAGSASLFDAEIVPADVIPVVMVPGRAVVERQDAGHGHREDGAFHVSVPRVEIFRKPRARIVHVIEPARAGQPARGIERRLGGH